MLRSLVAYQGTVFPHRRLDEGERPSGGEGFLECGGLQRAGSVAAKPSPVCGLVCGRTVASMVIVCVAW
jgi:hypothetical protein